MMPAAASFRAIRLLPAAAALLLAWLCLAGPAWAHASLVSTRPVDGDVLASAPETFSLTFSEPVSPLALRLVKPDGAALPLPDFELRDATLVIRAPKDLERGTHVLSWRVTSEDGHPVGGSVVFSIGKVSAHAPVASDAVDWTVRAGLWAGRLALYAGFFLGIGGAFALAWLLPAAAAGRRLVAWALAMGGVGVVVSAGFQGLDALGVPVSWLAERTVWSTGLGTSFGWTVLAAIVALVLAAAALAASGVPARILSAAALFGAGLALALSGHASAASPQWLMRPAVFLHVASAAFWAGALLPLGLALRRGLPDARAGLLRFSAAIPPLLLLLVAAGVVLAIVQVERPAALVDTAYGRVLLAKLALLVALFGLAAVNRWSLTASVQAGDPEATRRLVRSILCETLLVLLVLAVVAMWRFTPPPRALAIAAAQPAIVHVHADKAAGFVIVTPGRAGVVDVEIDTLDGEMQTLDPKEVTLTLSMPDTGIEPFGRKAVRQSLGVWRVEGITIPLPGRWKLGLDVLVSDFETARVEGEIEIRP